MKQVYPVLIAEYKKDFLVYVPDMEIYTEGKSMVECRSRKGSVKRVQSFARCFNKYFGYN